MLYKTNNDKNIVINTSIIDDDFYHIYRKQKNSC